MSNLRFCVCTLALTLLSAPALAKNETLAERGKRLCDEAGVPLEDCTALPPALRGVAPPTQTAARRPELRPAAEVVPLAYGTGTYGWCEDCTSLLGAAPVTPWDAFGGRQFQPINADGGGGGAVSADNGAPAGGDNGGGDNGGGDNGGGDNGGICD